MDGISNIIKDGEQVHLKKREYFKALKVVNYTSNNDEDD